MTRMRHIMRRQKLNTLLDDLVIKNICFIINASDHLLIHHFGCSMTSDTILHPCTTLCDLHHHCSLNSPLWPELDNKKRNTREKNTFYNQHLHVITLASALKLISITVEWWPWGTGNRSEKWLFQESKAEVLLISSSSPFSLSSLFLVTWFVSDNFVCIWKVRTNYWRCRREKPLCRRRSKHFLSPLELGFINRPVFKDDVKISQTVFSAI